MLYSWSQWSGLGDSGDDYAANLLASGNCAELERMAGVYGQLAGKSGKTASTIANAKRLASVYQSGAAQCKAAVASTQTQAAIAAATGETGAAGGVSLTSPLTLIQSPLGIAAVAGVALVGVGLFLVLRKKKGGRHR
jgi:anaerobic selenocysteine-containing dehydrogenase